MKPWEKYAKPKEDGPWSKYKKKPTFQEKTRAGFERVAGIPENLGSMAASAVAEPIAGMAGIAGSMRQFMPANVLSGDTENKGSEYIDKTRETLTGWARPRSERGQMLAEEIGKVGQKVDQFADTAGDVVGGKSPLAETAVKTLLLGGGTLLGAKGMPKARTHVQRAPATPKPAPKPVTKEAPSVDQLREAANKAYEAAENSGVFVKSDSYGQFVNDLKQTMAKEGLDKGLHPKAFRAWKRVQQDADKNLTLKGAETIRRNISDAASSMDKADQRMALIMRDKLDEFMEGLDDKSLLGSSNAPEAVQSLASARGLWSRVRKAEEIQGLIDRATVGKSKFSASGMENSLRNEFRALARNPKKMRRFTKDEQAAIRKVAEGGTVGNMMRFVGRFAPTGPVSSAVAAGIGAGIGGPAGAMAFGGAGAMGRMGATASTLRNARRAEELMRKGPNLDPRQQALIDQLVQ